MNACKDCRPYNILDPRHDSRRIKGICPKCWDKLSIAERLVAMRDEWQLVQTNEGIPGWEYCANEIWKGWKPAG